MTTHAPYAGQRLHLSDTAFRGCGAACACGATVGPVQSIGTPQRPSGGPLLPALRIMQAKAAKARDLRQSKASSIFEAECRALVRAIMEAG